MKKRGWVSGQLCLWVMVQFLPPFVWPRLLSPLHWLNSFDQDIAEMEMKAPVSAWLPIQLPPVIETDNGT